MIGTAVARAAGNSGTMRFSLDARNSGKSIMLTLKVRLTGTMDSRGGQILVAPCYPGPGHLRLVHNTRHLARGESLRPYTVPGFDWIYRYPARPAGVKQFTLKMPIRLYIGKGGTGYSFCASAVAIDKATGQYRTSLIAMGVK
jgi:hypothetical protein